MIFELGKRTWGLKIWDWVLGFGLPLFRSPRQSELIGIHSSMTRALFPAFPWKTRALIIYSRMILKVWPDMFYTIEPGMLSQISTMDCTRKSMSTDSRVGSRSRFLHWYLTQAQMVSIGLKKEVATGRKRRIAPIVFSFCLSSAFWWAAKLSITSTFPFRSSRLWSPRKNISMLSRVEPSHR